MVSPVPFSSMDVTLTSVFPHCLCLPDNDYWALLSIGHELFTSSCLLAQGPSSMSLCSPDFWCQSRGPQAYRTRPSQPWTLTPPGRNMGGAGLWSRCPFPPGPVGLEDQVRRGLWQRFPCRVALFLLAISSNGD